MTARVDPRAGRYVIAAPLAEEYVDQDLARDLVDVAVHRWGAAYGLDRVEGPVELVEDEDEPGLVWLIYPAAPTS